MAFGIAGAAAGGQRALEEIVAQRMLEQKLEAEIADRQERARLEEARLNEITSQNAWEREQAAKPRPDPLIEYEGRKKIDQQYEKPAVIKPDRDPIADYEARKKIDQQYEKPVAIKPERDPIADYEAKKKIDAKYDKTPGPGAPSAYATERSTRTLQSVDELMGKINNRTTGWGNLAAGIPASDAMNFASELDTLKANIAFNELTAMREASKTGGALGQVSNVELHLLESALGALNPRQSPENLKAQLAKIKESIGRWQAASGGQATMPIQPVSSHGTAPPAGGGKFTIIRKQ